MNKMLLLGCGCLLSVFAGLAEVLVVPDDYPSIQEAITASVPGDTVLVKEGTYNELINFMGKDIVVGSLFLSTGDTSYIGQTIISAPSQGSVVTFATGETSAALLTGFTITNGTGTLIAPFLFGGGIYVVNSSPTLDHLFVIFNTAGGFGGNGGGIYFSNSTSLVNGCRISNNESNRGGGIRFTQADVMVKNTWIKDNFVVASGGGIMSFQSSPKFEQCVFTGNQAAYGGAMSCYESNPLIDRASVYGNHGINGSGICAESFSKVLVINSIFWNNNMYPGVISEIQLIDPTNIFVSTYSDIQGGMEGIINPNESIINWLEGNLEIYPEFNDPNMLDLTLAESSPCINAGTTLFVYNGDTLVNITDYSGTAPDMGAYEHMEPVSSDPLPSYQLNIEFDILPGNSADERVICFSLSETRPVQLTIVDLRGREVSCLTNNTFPAGDQQVRMNIAGLPKGLYIVRLIAGNHSSSRKLLVC